MQWWLHFVYEVTSACMPTVSIDEPADIRVFVVYCPTFFIQMWEALAGVAEVLE